MSDPSRKHRPDPERTQPIRNWGTLFGPPPGAPPHPPSIPFAGPFGPPFAPPGAPPPAGPGAAVAQGVQAGYRVIEEYLRQGQNAARMMYGPWVGAAPGAPWSAPPAWSGGAMPSLGPWADLLQSMLGAFPLFWPPPPGEVHGAAGPFTAGQTPRGSVPIVTPPPAHHAAPAEHAARPASHAPHASHASHSAPAARVPVRAAVVVEAAPDQRAEVTVELLGARADGDFVVHALRLPDGEGYRITGATAEGLADDDLVRVTVRVPADAPPGAYSGLIIDRASGLPRGSVTARVLPRA